MEGLSCEESWKNSGNFIICALFNVIWRQMIIRVYGIVGHIDYMTGWKGGYGDIA